MKITELSDYIKSRIGINKNSVKPNNPIKKTSKSVLNKQETEEKKEGTIKWML